jgi:hypothetical protein
LLLTKQSQYLFLVAIKFFKQSYQYKLIWRMIIPNCF